MILTRRSLLFGLAAAPAAAAPPPRTPYTDRASVAFGLTPDGRIRPCVNALGSNCASTSSTSDLYAPPLLAEGGVEKAVDALIDAAARAYGARLRDRAALEGGAAFITLDVPAARGAGRDVIEVLAKPGGGGGTTILFRALADPASVTYIFPLQTPVSDQGAQKARVKALARDLGWRASGCDLLECFE